MQADWEGRYRAGDVPWDTDAPSPELARVVEGLPRGPALEVGCGTGTNAVFLAQQGFDVTACDVSPTALDRARERARAAGVSVRYVEADLLASPDLGGPWPLVFDRGVYHVLRRVDGPAYLRWLARVTPVGGWYLVQAGNANDGGDVGPPRVHAHELCAELQPWWDLVSLREIPWDIRVGGADVRVLAWSGLFRRASRGPTA
jgi:SAM-dependent methyltransferase